MTRHWQGVGKAIEHRIGVKSAAHQPAESRDVGGIEMKSKIRGDLRELRRRRTDDSHSPLFHAQANFKSYLMR